MLVSLSLESLHGEPVCLLMELTGKEKDALVVERECETIVRHALLEADGDAAQRLDSALKELNGLMKGMLVSGTIHDIHMLICIRDQEDVLHVSHAGRAEAYLIRRGTASQITEYAGRPTPAFVHIASGQLERGDLVILSSQRLLRTLTPAQLGKLTVVRDNVLESVVRALEAEGEHAAIAIMDIAGATEVVEKKKEEVREEVRARGMGSALQSPAQRSTRARRGALQRVMGLLSAISLPSWSSLTSWMPAPGRAEGGVRSRADSAGRLTRTAKSSGAQATRLLGMLQFGEWWRFTRDAVAQLFEDLAHPQRKKRAHLLLLASAIATLVIVWALVHLFTSSQRSKTRAELETLVEQISTEIQTAENRRIIGDTDAANAILQRAEERAKQVMDNESGLFRVEANELLGRIRSKHEEINNIIRLSPRVVANLAANVPDIIAQGMIGLGDGEFVIYDRQDLYRVLLNAVEAPSRLSEDVLILDGSNFPRFQTLVFLMNGGSVIESQGGQSVSMKTDDVKGWVAGKAIAAYLRYLYILAPESKQIYKYERLNNRYGVPVEYNVNGDLTGAIDMAIDGNVYVLKEGGKMIKLFRGEQQPFVIRRAPEGVLEGATKLYKVPERNFYALDPENGRVIVFSDGGQTGESSYLKQYVLEGEQVGTLKDLTVDEDESHLYVADEKRIYVIDLVGR